MLTEIEWWGGLIFVWLGLCYWSIYATCKEHSFDLDILMTHICFLVSGSLLAMFFYELSSNLFQNIYVGLLLFAIITFLLMMFLPDSQERKEKSEANGEPPATKAEELLGTVVLGMPMLIIYGLAGYKSMNYLANFGSF